MESFTRIKFEFCSSARFCAPFRCKIFECNHLIFYKMWRMRMKMNSTCMKALNKFSK